MSKFKRLLAKSLSDSDSTRSQNAATFTGHIALVKRGAEVLLKCLDWRIFQQLGLDESDLDLFANTVRLGAYLHDWGKANQHFQEMVYLNTAQKSPDPKKRDKLKKLRQLWQKHQGKQMIRHEVLSGILALRVPEFRNWLDQCPNADLVIAVWAAMGHHLKMSSDLDLTIRSGTGSGLFIYTDHDDFKQMLKMGRQLGLPANLPAVPGKVWQKQELERELKGLYHEFDQIEQQIIAENDTRRLRFIAAVKATVIAADLAGSALPVVEENIKDWIEKVLSITLSEDDLNQVLKQRLKGKKLRPFQQKIAATPHRITLVKAGCGTGKTIGAYAWAKKWAGDRKLFFGYPTTGTATQGFIDYAHETDIEADLMHSRADLDREILFSGDEDEGIEDRLAALTAWRQKLVVCTVDTVLGLMQNNRRSLYSWSAIAQAAFVFDEVHAYDHRLFGALLRFLDTFRGAPILLMSASFTEEQIQAIQGVVGELGEETEIIEGPQNLEVLPRYQIESIPSADHAWQKVRETLTRQHHNKVLWVTNSVNTCRELYLEAKEQISDSIPVLIYHSRYRYFDRLEKHKAVIDAFEREGAVLAITTQVCEMSLDLSADLLVTPIAPASALIQRLGRLNRRVITTANHRVKLASGKIAPALVYPWDDSRPYSQEELETGQQLVNQLAGNAISQQDLAKIVAQMSTPEQQPSQSEWLEGCWCSRPNFLREPGYTITVLLEEDLANIKNAANQRHDQSFKKERQRWTIPIRIIAGFDKWRRNGYYPIAPPDQVEYSSETGAK